MPSFTGFLQTLFLLGAVQGLIISFLLYFSTAHRRPNRLLAVLIFLIALANLRLYGLEKEIFHTSMLMSIIDAFVPMIMIMPVGPLLYFYVKTSLTPSYTLSKRDKWQFSAVLIDIVPQLTAAVFIVGVLTLQFRNNPLPWGWFIDEYNVYSDILRWSSVSVYVWLTYRLLKRQPIVTDELEYSPTLLPWLRTFVKVFAAFQLIWFLFLIPYVIPRYSNTLLDRLGWYPIYIPLVVMIYWLGIKGYLVSQKPLYWRRQVEPVVLPGNIVSADVMEQTVSALTQAMNEERLYLDPNLSVSVLAAHTGVASKTISAVLNQHFHKNFNEFVNEYRVNAIRDRMQQGDARQMTIASLAYECGFNSLSTFQRAFKSIMGVTPREYLSKKS